MFTVRIPSNSFVFQWIASLLVIFDSTAALSPAHALLNSGRPLVIAHRGYSAIAPENSRPAFERALAAGSDLVELDYHHSKDGVPVAIHDFTLDRTTDAVAKWGGSKLKVADHTLAQLRELESGLWFKPAHPHAMILTLKESVGIIQNGSVTLIERKAGDAATCVELLKENGWINQVVVQAFDWNYIREFRALDSNQVLAALGPPGTKGGKTLTEAEKRLSSDWLDEIKSLGVQIAAWNRQVDKRSVEEAHKLGLRVWVYTINDEATANTLIEAGVDGIITDNPALIWKTLATRPAAKQ
ncbi:MAG: hypothetical protein FJ405_02190 [Verrucomicrobia bacterium]|nr:hypothetical protein [Verrucomicrobiota bacterium]